jgi:aryl-alcohol dehydrogenase-like predicted oxidoreductase
MKNPLHLSGVALGTFPFSNVFGKVSSEEAKSIVTVFLYSGVGYIQTAPYYKGVDELMAKILADIPRDSYILGTLCVKDRNSNISGKYESVIAQCNESLQKLGVDYLDLYLTSTPKNNDVPFAETIEAMTALRQQGKIRAIGVCNVTLAELKEYNATGAVSYVQNRFSIIDQETDRGVRQYCLEDDIGLIPYNVIEWGLLTEKSLESWELSDNDLRKKVLPVFEDEPKAVVGQWIKRYLSPIAKEYDTSIEALAIAWVLGQSGVSTALVGATKQRHIESSLLANKLIDKKSLINDLDTAYGALVKDIKTHFDQNVNDFLRNSFGKW